MKYYERIFNISKKKDMSLFGSHYSQALFGSHYLVVNLFFSGQKKKINYKKLKNSADLLRREAWRKNR